MCNRNFATDIENDRLDRLRNLGIRIYLFQSVPLDERPAHGAGTAGPIVIKRLGEVANSGIRVAAFHGLLGSQQHACLKQKPHARGYGVVARVGLPGEIFGIRGPGLGKSHLDVLREYFDALDVGSLRVHLNHSEPTSERQVTTRSSRSRDTKAVDQERYERDVVIVR